MRNQLITLNSPEKKTAILSDLAYRYSISVPDSSYYFAKKALEISHDLPLSKYQAYSYSDIGRYHKFKANFDSTLYYYQKSLEMRLQLGEPLDIASGYNLVGTAYYKKENYPAALNYFQKGLDTLFRHPKPGLKAKLLSGKGMSLFRAGKIDSASHTLEMAARHFEELGDSLGMAKELQNLGNLYMETDSWARAGLLYEEALGVFLRFKNYQGIADIYHNQGNLLQQQGKWEEAMSRYDASRKICEQFGFTDLLPKLLQNMALLRYRQGKLTQAEPLFHTFLELSRAQQKPLSVIEATHAIARIKIHQKQFSPAIGYLAEARDSIEGNEFTTKLPENLDLEATALAGLGRFSEAYVTQQKATSWRDSLDKFQLQVRVLTDEIEISRQEREKYKRRAEVKAAELLAEKATSNQKTILLISIPAVLILLLTILWIRFNSRIKQSEISRQLAETKSENTEKNEEISRLTRDSELNILRTRLEVEDRERKRIAKDLHDHLGSTLAVVQMKFESLAPYISEMPEKARENFITTGKLIEESCGSTRNIAHNLQHGSLSQHGLVKSIEKFCSDINSTQTGGLHITFQSFDLPPRLPRELENQLFPIIRTLIENILNHAQATRGTIQLFYEDEQLRITVEDNGKGFSQEDIRQSTGMGIRNVKERAKALSGSADFDSSKGVGTFVSIQIPLSNYPQS